MLTGRRAFQKATSVETLTAILREEPEPIATTDVPPPLRWIVERLLSKSPEDRYDSTRDLARDLQRVRDSLSDSSLSSGAAAAVAARMPRRPNVLVPVVVAAIVLAGATWIAAKRFIKPDTPKFHRLTFRRGYITTARFAPDGQTIVYGGG